ncbi:MAG TPA: hypothetical protein VFR40_15580, partial [Lapillicoccus sp.]|nr:hypothetical protein [Lapillicoccus sp.]
MAPSYRFGKGPIVVALEATLRNKVTFDKLYADLTKALGQITSAGDTNFTSDFKTQLAQEQRDHLDKDVFGEGQPDQIAAAEGRQRRVVYYEGLKRAMDLALNLG